jgi:hypothetical protein
MSRDEPIRFAAPDADLGPRVGEVPVMSSEVWRDGEMMVFRKGARLDGRCVKCNAPGDGRMLGCRLRWHPWWVYLTWLAAIPWFYYVVAGTMEQTARIEIGLCSWHRSLRNWTIVTVWLVVIGSILAIFLALEAESESSIAVILTAFATLLFSSIYGLRATRMIAAKEIEKYYVWVKGVCPEYLERLPSVD